LIRFDEDVFDFVSLVAEVVAVDLLFNHDRLDMEAIAKNLLQIGQAIDCALCTDLLVQVGEAFRRSVYDPAWKRLRQGQNLNGRRVLLYYICLFIEQSRTRNQHEPTGTE
jgi:hypothetical protein